MTGRIALEGIEIHAFHGVYPHERESGNWFTVDVAVDADITEGALQDNLEGTVNYETLYKIIQHEMDMPSKLLETVAAKIIKQIFEQLPTVSFAEVKIAKLNPPIGGKCKKSSVTISQKR